MGPTANAEQETAANINPPIPLLVEESRAKRLQRQQARFRDRGGIFVPSNRNTLIDILLGRKVPSPQKRRSRSISCSPVKSKSKEPPVRGQRATTIPASSNKRTSPRKLFRRQANEEEAIEPIAGPLGPSKRIGPTDKPKVVKKAQKGEEKADEPPVVPKRRGRPPKAKADVVTVASGSQAKATNKELDPEPKPKGRKRAAMTSTRTTAKKGRPRKKVGLGAAEGGEGGINGGAVDPSSTSKSSAPVAKPKAKGRKPPPPKPYLDIEIEPANPLSRRARSRREKGVYLEPSDDDTAPATKASPTKKVEEDPTPVRKLPDKKENGRQHIASVEEEDSEHSPEAENPPETRLPSKKRIRSRSDGSDGVSVKDDDIGPRKRARAEVQSSTESTDLVASKPRAKKLRVDDKSQKEPVSDDGALGDDDIGSIKRPRAQPRPKARAKKTDLVAKKSQNTKDEVDDRPRKESNQPSEDVKPHLSDKKASSKKRPLDPPSEDPQKPAAKRSKVKPRVELEDVAPPEPKDPKVSRSEKDGQGTKVARTSRKLKENIGRGAKALKSAHKEGKISAKAPKSAPTIVPRRPPKSVLERIKEPRPEIEDDTPDPIDFLS